MPNPSTIAMQDEWDSSGLGGADPTSEYFYLAGPMSGIPKFNFPAFDRAASALRARGYNIVSPAELDDPDERNKALASPDGGHQQVGGDDWREFLRRDVNIVMDEKCSGVICLDGWEQSRGAKLETYVAAAFEKPIMLFTMDFTQPALTLIDRDLALKIYEASQEVI